jgi:hypothetical protein
MVIWAAKIHLYAKKIGIDSNNRLSLQLHSRQLANLQLLYFGNRVNLPVYCKL